MSGSKLRLKELIADKQQPPPSISGTVIQPDGHRPGLTKPKQLSRGEGTFLWKFTMGSYGQFHEPENLTII